MIWTHRAVLTIMAVCAAPYVWGQAPESVIMAGIEGLRSLSTEQRPIETVKLAAEVNALPAGKEKLEMADALSNLVTEGDQGQATIQAVANTLAAALKETPETAGKGVPMPYMDLARLVRYEHVTAALDAPFYERAMQTLAEHDAEAAKANFTLKDLSGRPYTLSALRGKIVLVNFWATWCPPCRVEMPALDGLYKRFKPQGLVVLSITDEKPATISAFLSHADYRPPVLIDTGDTVHNLYHVEAIPETFVYNRKGKLVGEAVDERTERQFLKMLSAAGLKAR